MYLAGYSGEFIGKGIPEQPMCLASIRMNLSCDEKLGPVLTIVGEQCLYPRVCEC